MCIDMDPSVALGTSPVPALSDWSKCTVDSVAKLESTACIYDHQLYAQSNKLMGYDVCAAEFNQGVYVFEDTFEHWTDASFQNNSMRSATWGEIVNGFSNSHCGAGQHFGGQRSLSFQGSFNRFATTSDLDVSSGGKVEAEMFMPPVGYDVSNEFCKTGFIGIVYVQYSADRGGNWTTMKSFVPVDWRANEFFSISLDIPPKARTNATRFRFTQPVFEAAIDNWALDNVRVLRNLPENWHTSSSFRANSLHRAWDYIQKAQCCVDTDWCNHRLTDKELESCADEFPLWYSGEKYLIRLAEMLLCAIVLINLLKLIYNSVADFLISGRVPLHDEILELFEYDLVTQLYKKYIPVRYRHRPLLHANEYVNGIHTSARMEEKLREQFKDEEGEGELVKRKEVLEKERRKEQRKIKRQQKRLDERRKNKNFQVSTITVDQAEEFDDLGPETKEDTPFGGQTLMTDVDKFRRQNVAMLRIPFKVEVDEKFRSVFWMCALGVFTVIFVTTLGLTKYYSIHEPILAFGLYPADLELTSTLVVFFAAFCDLKEVYFTLKFIVPARDRWLPLVTIDLSEEVRCLFVGERTVPLGDIHEIHAFPESFMRYCLAAYTIGAFPWCLFSLLLREAYMEFTSMRVVTPMIGVIAILRAVLGPSFVVKCFFSLKFLMDGNYRVREHMGVAFQQDNTFNSAVNTAIGMTAVGVLITAAVAYDYVPIVIGVGVGFGLVYGAFTGCMHNLPIKPWICECFLMFVMFLGPFLTICFNLRHDCAAWRCVDVGKETAAVSVCVLGQILHPYALVRGGICGVHHRRPQVRVAHQRWSRSHAHYCVNCILLFLFVGVFIL